MSTKKAGVIFTCHLQRVLHALPSVGQISMTDDFTIHLVSGNVYTFPQPLRPLTKSTTSASARPFLPTPFKNNARQGALYRERAVVSLRIPIPAMSDASDTKTQATRIGSFLLRLWAIHSLIRLALTEFLNNLHSFQTSALQGFHSKTPAAHSGPTHITHRYSSRRMLTLSSLARESQGRRL
ncbi:hypothetical protein BDR05DRAFT_1005880 [Suillus weaverae]|nr:hypothetical protein BDR05DRAFT_1005880 [Suillus weaverae]